jgi:hypothetical protein
MSCPNCASASSAYDVAASYSSVETGRGEYHGYAQKSVPKAASAPFTDAVLEVLGYIEDELNVEGKHLHMISDRIFGEGAVCSSDLCGEAPYSREALILMRLRNILALAKDNRTSVERLNSKL